jgi:hypothetical protein
MTLQIIVVGLTLWTLLGSVVAMLVCPMLKNPDDIEITAIRETADEVCALACCFRTTGQSYLN